MTPGLRTSASGMIAQQKRVDVIANNLANVNTTGFKRSRTHFEDLLYETIQGPRRSGTGAVVSPMQIGHGVRLNAITRIDTQGGAEITGRPLDIALEGEGFFQVEMPDGTIAYTRDGSFSLSDAGQLVTNSGQLLLPGIVLPPDTTNVTISETGMVSVTNPADGMALEIGRLELARFANPTGLLSLGGNLLAESDASGHVSVGFPGEDGFARVLQGALESSNVEIVQEMTDMIAAQRAYEINARAIRAAEDMMRSLDDLIR
ncbi:MAG: flagellar basal-body rod protein FlgG [Gemmatimonadales bacterium]|jgi:flagellar basal-body rod protein FlgG|nr:flagellar basal-body rod protein FlgG [Gemmatimonadales bacterium]MDZ4257306.1 flagellar basal-body rod protein FlgG [Gemmatimonadales bacterium]MDZ4388941.1 flagellar basal-body rod protein FlgG [Gemmatimonadales bacterium]PKL93344.1 MAG: flagellar basal-body rod protein FlgG [Gemmatimonadetes bacterium HGW-Gemmatimonadetes-1]